MKSNIMQAIAQLPPLAYHNDRIDVQLRIYRSGARYSADVFAVGHSLRVPIELTPGDLASLNRQLQEGMQKVALMYAKGIPHDPQTQLRELAKVGNYAYKRVFGHPTTMQTLQDVMRLGANISWQITSEDFFLPWEILYPCSLDDEVSAGNFWGMNYVISRVIVQDARPGAYTSPEISVEDLPKLGLVTYTKLTGVQEKEIPFFEKMAEEGKIRLIKLRALNPDKRQEEFKVFKGFWQDPLHLAHFACHAVCDCHTQEKSYLLLSDEFEVSLIDLTVHDFSLAGHPLIIMNACETGNLNPLYTSCFAAEFLKFGALGVVATECQLPDNFAADFARELYGHLLAGELLGESLMTTRRSFLDNYNPSGLLYAMYAPPSIHLIRANKS